MSHNPFDLIDARLSNIESLLIDLKFPTTPPSPEANADRWMNIQELCDYLPGHPKRNTVYFWVSDKQIPAHKKSKHLCFLKSEIDLWLKSDKPGTSRQGRPKRPK